MAEITYDNVVITGITYTKLINIEISKKMNTHSEACITCEVTKEQADTMLSGMNDGDYVTIASAETTGVLFLGVKYNLEITETGDYRTAKLELKSTSYLLDKTKKSRTFQNTKAFYHTVMEKIVGEQAVIRFHITDSMMGSFCMQKDETDWAMILRLASQCGACVIVNVTTKKPIINIGVDNDVSEDLEIGLSTEEGQSHAYVTETNSTFQQGTLQTTYITGAPDAFRQKRISNENTAGKMFTGIVKAVEKEKVQVFFVQIDAEYDSAGDTWFEYSTAYAGKGGAYGSGMYFMPEVDDKVRVFFPNGDDGEGFAFASETSYVLDDPSKISWKAPGGQELLFTKNGIRVIGKENSIYIDLSDDDASGVGIQIYSEMGINLSTHPGEAGEESSIWLYGKEELLMSADNQIVLETPEAKIEMDKDKIILNANQVYIN